VEEIAPGLWHWTALRESIGSEVSSYYLEPERVLIDPMTPPGGVEWLEEHGGPEHVLLTCRHHDRDSWKLREAFGCTVHVVSSGAYELEGRGPFETYEWGDELPGGVSAQEVDSLSPDETALYIPAHRALAVGDGLVRWPPRPGICFVPDQYMDDPEQTKAGLRNAYRGLLGLDFDLLLIAHGDPAVGGAKDEIRAYLDAL
jgi:glyoxylase-like metal-dependent hydrolase (beta-lactamase superfamily II)